MKPERFILSINVLLILALLSLVSFRVLQTGDNAKLLSAKIDEMTKTVNKTVDNAMHKLKGQPMAPEPVRDARIQTPTTRN